MMLQVFLVLNYFSFNIILIETDMHEFIRGLIATLINLFHVIRTN